MFIEIPQGNVQILQRLGCQRIDQGKALLHGEAVLARLFRRETVTDDEIRTSVLFAGGGDGIDHGERETQAICGAAAPSIAALIGLRGVELLNQIAVCTVDFHAVETGL